jgi:hypothetical protein
MSGSANLVSHARKVGSMSSGGKAFGLSGKEKAASFE